MTSCSICVCLITQSKTCLVRFILAIEFFFMTIFPELRVPHPFYAPINRTFALLDPSWCYHYTRFTNQQLQLLYDMLYPPPCIIIQKGKWHCSSEEAFIIMFVKLAMEATSLGLQDLFSEKYDQWISNIYNHTIWWLESKLQGFFQQPCLQQWKDNFQTFADIIKHKLGILLSVYWTVNCKICETCRPRSGSVEDWQLAPGHEDAEILQESVSSGCIRCHGLKILSTVFPNGLIG